MFSFQVQYLFIYCVGSAIFSIFSPRYGISASYTQKYAMPVYKFSGRYWSGSTVNPVSVDSFGNYIRTSGYGVQWYSDLSSANKAIAAQLNDTDRINNANLYIYIAIG